MPTGRGRRDGMSQASTLPVIDMSPLRIRSAPPAKLEVARQIESACRDSGFFYVKGHGIPAELFARLDSASRKFFALPEAEKLEIRMARGGRAWRGYFPVGGELTSGKPDMKQGLYFGEELDENDERVIEGLALHGRNLFPADVPELKGAVLAFMEEATQIGRASCR